MGRGPGNRKAHADGHEKIQTKAVHKHTDKAHSTRQTDRTVTQNCFVISTLNQTEVKGVLDKVYFLSLNIMVSYIFVSFFIEQNAVKCKLGRG